MLAVVAYLAARRAPLRDRLLYLGAMGLLLATAMLLGIGDRHAWVHPSCAARYFHAPGVLLMLLMLSQLELQSFRSFTPNQRGLALALALGLVLQASEWRSRIISPKGQPHWQQEVAAWRRDPTHPLGIWPAGWNFAIPAARR